MAIKRRAFPVVAQKSDDVGAWQRSQRDLLHGLNIYNPHVLRVEGEAFYRMYFFGWAHTTCNQGYSGCDAIFTARSLAGKGLTEWEVYSGEGRPWDRTDNSSLWVPVVTAGNESYDSVHNGDPSVVHHGGSFFMAFSSSGPGPCPADGPCVNAAPGQAVVYCVHMARSSDGIRWRKATRPPLLYAPAKDRLRFPALAPPFHGSYPYYARPSLMRDGERWRLWFDYLYPPGGMGHATCDGEPMDSSCWKVTHSLREPLIVGWPNSAVIKVAHGYLAYGDPAGYNSTEQPKVWTTRQIREASSANGLNWTVGAYLPPDSDAPADQVPETILFGSSSGPAQALFYASPPEPAPSVSTWMYPRIRFMQRPLKLDDVGAPIRLHPDNPHYFLWRGRPTVLIGGGEHYGAVLNSAFNYTRYLRTIAAAGYNVVRTWSGAYAEVPGAFSIERNTLAPAAGALIAPWARSTEPGYVGGGNKFDLDRCESFTLGAKAR